MQGQGMQTVTGTTPRSPGRLPRLYTTVVGCFLLAIGLMSTGVAASDQRMAHAGAHESIVLIFNHGSKSSGEKDFCEPNGRSTPDVIKQLQGERVGDKSIVVYELCTEAIGIAGQLGSKNEGRILEIEAVIRDFQRRGVPPEQLFLAGQSAGAWASLMIARRHTVEFNATIAFAPANSGKKASRTAAGTERLERLSRYLSEAPYLPALVYAFAHDEFNDTATLAFLREVRGVAFVPLDDQAIDGIACSTRWSAHLTAFKDCFTMTQKRVILDYIARRVLTPSS